MTLDTMPALLLGFIAGWLVRAILARVVEFRRTQPRPTFPRPRKRPEEVPAGILASVEGIDTVCPDCEAHHVRHPAMRDPRCGPCVALAFDASVEADTAEQRDWLAGDDRDDAPKPLVRLT